MSENSLLTTGLVADLLAKRLDAHMKWTKSPAYQRMLAEMEAERRAKPLTERAIIRTRAWIDRKRQRLGEKIAGRSFDD